MALRRLKKTLPYLALVLASLAACEAALRVYDHFFPSFLFAPPDSPAWRPKPGFQYYDGFRLNSGGYLDLETAVPKPAGSYRIAFIGDSFVIGIVPYEHNFTTLIEKTLSGNGRTEVVNMGVPSTDTDI